VSFISIAKVLPKVAELMNPTADVLAMVKPQFEGTPKEVPGGFVKDEPTRQLILARTREAIQAGGFQIKAESDSVVKGRQGNQETFFLLKTIP
jgi:23S rRNA (cytidine1920-2'-O)/16S rRNA (cytidine1409-2'-O)-methyltransferase